MQIEAFNSSMPFVTILLHYFFVSVAFLYFLCSSISFIQQLVKSGFYDNHGTGLIPLGHSAYKNTFFFHFMGMVVK